uniref:NADPH HC toxin reductase-like protein n=1 Tax=Zea mays TaxID=4577 RepID=B0FYX0_MAIZE|nr:NADPH HC toxin reductase-like protein [Zea mays]
MGGGTVVCVTGGSGYLGSWLVRKLLGRGCVVHATLRSLADEKKTGLLRALPGAAERLRLFEADMYDADTFEPAIAGCHFVFLVATPLTHDPTSTKYKNTTEAAVDAARIILRQCALSGTVKRVIHTASVTAASPLKEDGSGYKDFADESNWTPLNLSCEFSNAYLDDYVRSKTLSEKELLSYSSSSSSKEDDRTRALEVVTLTCGLVGGDSIQTYLWGNIAAILAPLTGQAVNHNALLFLQALLGSVPLVHVEDVCQAHVFCMEQESMTGRFLCAAGYPNMRDIVDHFAAKQPRPQDTADSSDRRRGQDSAQHQQAGGLGVQIQVWSGGDAGLQRRVRQEAGRALDACYACMRSIGIQRL